MRDKFEAVQDKRAAVNAADESGQVADSMAVRLDLIWRWMAGEITPDEMQAELKAIKRNAKKNGLKTRSQVWTHA